MESMFCLNGLVRTRSIWLLTSLLLFVAPIASQVAEPSKHSHARDESAAVSAAWPELIQSMNEMHKEMGAIHSSGAADADFVRLMIPHHQAALDMAKAELLHGTDPQMKRLAQEIIADQQSEIELMRLWLKQHAGGSR